MDRKWDFYFCHVDDKPASIYVDLHLRDQAPLAALPDRAYLSLVLRQPRPDGLSSHDEFDALKAIEDALEEHLASPTTMYVGRNTSDGRRDYWFYVADAAAWKRQAADFMARFPDYSHEAESEPDPAWSAYLEFLYPNEQGWDFITNRQVCDSLEENGDPLTQAREIEHWAYFPDASSCEVFVARVTALGFEVRESWVTESAGDEVGVRLVRRDVPSHRDIHDVTVPLLRAARDAGGRYDGWETQCLPSNERRGSPHQ
ncbi:DUF695 domain-containing protein [Lysobacter sp.]|uniref:DUF695 domain-containing protein n=1 Tax=Lysobacter sp. TaxID=72226 RepID=UPI002D30F6BC|nr:DUF695 domain-containing protein [Lysobacter sp.]HZX77434.1 DUF695 domain-containing protein [Lysobacter sp.]